DRPPLDAGHMAELLALEVGEALDVAVRLDDETVIDQADLDPAALQPEHFEGPGKLRFRQHGDAGRRAGRAEIRARADQRIDDLVGRLQLVRDDLDTSLFEQLLLQRDVIGGGLHDRQPHRRYFFHTVARGVRTAGPYGHGGQQRRRREELHRMSPSAVAGNGTELIARTSGRTLSRSRGRGGWRRSPWRRQPGRAVHVGELVGYLGVDDA